MRYLIEVEQVRLTPVIVEADSEQEALEQLEGGSLDPGDNVYLPYRVVKVSKLEG